MTEIELSAAKPRTVRYENKVFFPNGTTATVDENLERKESGGLRLDAKVRATADNIQTLVYLAKTHRRPTVENSFLYIQAASGFDNPFPSLTAVPNPCITSENINTRSAELESIVLQPPKVTEAYRWLSDQARQSKNIGRLFRQMCSGVQAEEFVEFVIENSENAGDAQLSDLRALWLSIQNYSFEKETREQKKKSDYSTEITVSQYHQQQMMSCLEGRTWYDFTVPIYRESTPIPSLRWLTVTGAFRFRPINRRDESAFQLDIKSNFFCKACDHSYYAVESELQALIEQGELPGFVLLHSSPQEIIN